MQTVLITGGAGFIGSHITEKLTNKGYSVIIVDNFSSGKMSNLESNSNLKIFNENILSQNLDKIFEETKPDYCIHLAAQTSVASAMNDPMKDAQINICGSINVLSLCKKYGIKKFLTASTAAVYGTPESLPIKETARTNPISYYGLSKLTMEQYVKSFGVDYIIFRFSNVYGPRQNNQGEAGVISLFDKKMKNNEQIIIEDDGEQTRDFLYVEDVANACLWAISSDTNNEIINVSTNVEISINELFLTMSKIYHYDKKPKYAAKRNGDIKNSILDNTKYLTLSNNKNFVDLYAGLNKNYDYHKAEK